MFQVVRIPLLKTRFDPPSSLSFGRSESKKVVNKDGDLRRHKESAALERPAPSSGCPTRPLQSPGHLLALPGAAASHVEAGPTQPILPLAGPVPS